MLKITAPFKEKEEVVPLIEAGASELYCGYLPEAWQKKFASLEFERKGASSTFRDIGELDRAVSAAHKKHVPVYLALNGLYVKEQYPILLKAVKQLIRLDLDGFIVADIGLLLTLKKLKFRGELHISTGCTVFNSASVKFFKELGASRIILDRQVTLGQIKELALNNPGIDFEVFILNTLCVYIDGFCTYLHIYDKKDRGDIHHAKWGKDDSLKILTSFNAVSEGDACLLDYSISPVRDKDGKRINSKKIRPAFYKHLNDGTECGACSLYDLSETKIKSVKIVGRQFNPCARLLDTSFIGQCLKILDRDRGISKTGFMQSVQELYRKTYSYKGPCRGNNCYHPEVCAHLKRGL